jgi:hypothetical protein
VTAGLPSKHFDLLCGYLENGRNSSQLILQTTLPDESAAERLKGSEALPLLLLFIAGRIVLIGRQPHTYCIFTDSAPP